MSNLFNFSNLDVNLDRSTKSASVLIYRSQEKFSPQNFINELETLFNWLTNKLEISSVTFEFQEENYSLFPENILLNFSETQLKSYIEKCQKLCWSQLLLPQTIIWNMGKSKDFSFWQLAMGSDIRICHEECKIEMNCLNSGHAPLIAGPNLMERLINPSMIKSWSMIGLEIESSKIINSGLAHLKDSFKLVKSLQQRIANQSPTARIQYKRSINNTLINNFEDFINIDKNFILSTLITADWKTVDNEEFMNPKIMKKILKSVKESA